MCAAAAVLAPRKKMVVVDPELRVRALLNRLVNEEGWNLQEASDNEAVLSLVRTTSLDLIVTGLKTSGCEDIALLRKIRAVRPHVRMIILTEFSMPDDVVESLRHNAFSYFRPPFDAASFNDIVLMAMTEPCWDDGIEVISATRRWIRLLARCTTQTAHRLVHFLRQADLPETERDELAVAAHEILLNAMEHGAGFNPDQYVEIGYLRTTHAVLCRVKDPGAGFSLDELRHAAINGPPGDLFSHMDFREKQGIRPGGFGILLATKHVDEVIYGEHGNDVILVKYLGSHAVPRAAGPIPLVA